jgi:hypothetical protein
MGLGEPIYTVDRSDVGVAAESSADRFDRGKSPAPGLDEFPGGKPNARDGQAGYLPRPHSSAQRARGWRAISSVRPCSDSP